MADKKTAPDVTKTDQREIAKRVQGEFPGLTRLLAQKVGSELRVREGPQPNQYTFFRKDSNGSKDIGVCSCDNVTGRKTYTGYIPGAILEVQELCGINHDKTGRYETLRLDLGTGSPITLAYARTRDEENNTVVKREDSFPQIPFP